MSKLSLFERIVNQVVQDTPPDITACEDCRKTACHGEQFKTCKFRKATREILEGGSNASG